MKGTYVFFRAMSVKIWGECMGYRVRTYEFDLGALIHVYKLFRRCVHRVNYESKDIH